MTTTVSIRNDSAENGNDIIIEYLVPCASENEIPSTTLKPGESTITHVHADCTLVIIEVSKPEIEG